MRVIKINNFKLAFRSNLSSKYPKMKKLIVIKKNKKDLSD